MEAYFHNRNVAKLNELPTSKVVENKIFSNERYDDKEYEKLVLKNSTFATMGFKNNSFKDCQFKYCTFINCYFRNASFVDVEFTGCNFYDCNFDGTSYNNCDFRYAKFKDCFINYDDFKCCLPKEDNLKRKLCMNLSIESLKSGFEDEYKKYYFEEKDATERYNYEIFLRRQPYYKNKYNSWEAFLALIQLIIGKINKCLWGYGEKLTTLLKNIFLIILVFSIIYCLFGEVYLINDNTLPIKLNFFDSIYLSICKFTNLPSSITSTTPYMRYFFIAEGVFGLILMGFFITALYRNINRR